MNDDEEKTDVEGVDPVMLPEDWVPSPLNFGTFDFKLIDPGTTTLQELLDSLRESQPFPLSGYSPNSHDNCSTSINTQMGAPRDDITQINDSPKTTTTMNKCLDVLTSPSNSETRMMKTRKTNHKDVPKTYTQLQQTSTSGFDEPNSRGNTIANIDNDPAFPTHTELGTRPDYDYDWAPDPPLATTLRGKNIEAGGLAYAPLSETQMMELMFHGTKTEDNDAPKTKKPMMCHKTKTGGRNASKNKMPTPNFQFFGPNIRGKAIRNKKAPASSTKPKCVPQHEGLHDHNYAKMLAESSTVDTGLSDSSTFENQIPKEVKWNDLISTPVLRGYIKQENEASTSQMVPRDVEEAVGFGTNFLNAEEEKVSSSTKINPQSLGPTQEIEFYSKLNDCDLTFRPHTYRDGVLIPAANEEYYRKLKAKKTFDPQIITPEDVQLRDPASSATQELPNRKHICKYCFRGFDVPYKLANHIQIHQHPQLHRCNCDKCGGIPFRDFRTMSRHHNDKFRKD